MGESIACAIGEIASYIAGLIIGRSFNLEPRQAQKIGEYVIFFIIIGLLITITFVYS
jgi:hypothetical protein